MRKKFYLFILSAIVFYTAQSETLKPGFNKDEYIALLKVSAQFGGEAYAARMPVPAGYQKIYRSPIMGLDNCWELWETNDDIPVISIRGTTKNAISWMENFYAAMIPAKGKLQLSDTETFDYHLADDPHAAVHVGWMIGNAFLSKDILPKIDSCYKKGRHDFYIIGHSQGGAIAYLLTAYLHSLQKRGKMPKDIYFKTYCSAAPKPGNLYFAYAYENITQNGWAYNVVNAADWVPQTPFSVQTISDFVAINPFENVNPIIKKMKFPKRLFVNIAYGNLVRPGNKAKKRYQKYLGNYVAKTIQKALPGFQPPSYFNSNDYVRAGNIITLLPEEDYYQKFPQNKNQIFINHLHEAYLYLVTQLKY